MEWLLQKAIESGSNNELANIIDSHAVAIENNSETIIFFAQVLILNFALLLALTIYVILSHRNLVKRLKKFEQKNPEFRKKIRG